VENSSRYVRKTFRIAIRARRMKLVRTPMSTVEAVVYVLSLSRLISDLGSPSGFARSERTDLVDHLHDRDSPYTSALGLGPDRPVTTSPNVPEPARAPKTAATSGG
jgi:hypothetical protein